MLCFAATNVKRAAHESVVFLAPVRQIGLTTADLAVAFKLRHYGASAGLHWYRLIASDMLSGADFAGDISSAMTGSLSGSQCRAYARDGYLGPLPALTAAEAQAYLDRLATFEAATGQAAVRAIRGKGHLKLAALYQLVFDARILDAVESVIGPDILCWGSTMFIKGPQAPGVISWHQDSYFFALDGEKIVSVWLALAPSTMANGAMCVVPGSHRGPSHAHRVSSPGNNNLIESGEEIALSIDPEAAVPLFLRPGEMSLHDANLVHGSGPNRSAVRRCGYAIRYLAPDVRPLGAAPTATLVRGRDRHGHFAPDPVPDRNLDPAIIALIDARRTAGDR